MQNKPNLREAQMNVNKVLTKGYENYRLPARAENKPNQTQFSKRFSDEYITKRFQMGSSKLDVGRSTNPFLKRSKLLE
jgi:hypothetical protein